MIVGGPNSYMLPNLRIPQTTGLNEVFIIDSGCHELV